MPVHYSTICKWELRSRDRRVAQSVPNIFYKLKKLQIRQIQGSASLSLRKCKTKGKTYTAGDLKSESSVNKLINLDEGFRVLQSNRMFVSVEYCNIVGNIAILIARLL